MKTFTTLTSAAALSLAIAAGAPAFAQMSDAVSTGLAQLGFATDGLMLTEEQELEVQNVINSSDDDDTKKARIEQIIGE